MFYNRELSNIVTNGKWKLVIMNYTIKIYAGLVEGVVWQFLASYVKI